MIFLYLLIGALGSAVLHIGLTMALGSEWTTLIENVAWLKNPYMLSNRILGIYAEKRWKRALGGLISILGLAIVCVAIIHIIHV